MRNNKKKTFEEVKKLFEDNGYELLSKQYINGESKLEFKCPNGHIHSIRYFDFQKGKRCGKCIGKHKTFEEVKKLFEDNGYELLSKQYLYAHSKLEFKCPNGHIYSITYANFQQGKRCKKCFHENNKGKNHFAWSSILTDEERIQNRDVTEIVNWRKEVYKRDNYKCQKCFEKKKKIEAHHIFNYADYPKLRYNIENGITLCQEHHVEFHSVYGRHNNTKKQLDAYLLDDSRIKRLAVKSTMQVPELW